DVGFGETDLGVGSFISDGAMIGGVALEKYAGAGLEVIALGIVDLQGTVGRIVDVGDLNVLDGEIDLCGIDVIELLSEGDGGSQSVIVVIIVDAVLQEALGGETVGPIEEIRLGDADLGVGAFGAGLDADDEILACAGPGAIAEDVAPGGGGIGDVEIFLFV